LRLAPDAALRVRLQLETDRLSAVVADYGQSFEPGLVRAGSGMRRMHDRIAGAERAAQTFEGSMVILAVAILNPIRHEFGHYRSMRTA
jgi:glucose-6-phosphate-specific signal transduction histidine kinase